MINLGKVAYETYMSIVRVDYPHWEDVSREIRHAWDEAAHSVVVEHIAITTLEEEAK